MASKDAKVRYWATRPFGYGGRELDRGQVLALIGAPNDEKLVRLAYFKPLDPREDVYTCAHCGAEFIGVGERTSHGQKRHRERPEWMTPEQWEDEQEKAFEAEQRKADQLNPLNLEATAASKK